MWHLWQAMRTQTHICTHARTHARLCHLVRGQVQHQRKPADQQVQLFNL